MIAGGKKERLTANAVCHCNNLNSLRIIKSCSFFKINHLKTPYYRLYHFKSYSVLGIFIYFCFLLLIRHCSCKMQWCVQTEKTMSLYEVTGFIKKKDNQELNLPAGSRGWLCCKLEPV